MSSGRARSRTCSPNSYPSPRLGLPKSRSNAARPSWPMKCFARGSPACSTNQSMTGCSTSADQHFELPHS
eukprot:14341707-Alexandrium_andersonii.AAC.1